MREAPLGIRAGPLDILGGGQGWLGMKTAGAWPPSSHESSQPPLCRWNWSHRGNDRGGLLARTRADAATQHPAPPVVPSVPSRGSSWPQAGPFWLCVQPSWSQEATRRKLGAPGAAVGPSQPGLVAGWSSGSRVAIALLDSAGRRGQGQGGSSPPATPGQHVDMGKKSLPLSTWAAGAYSARADRSGEKPTAPTTHPPCQIVLNYNDKRWQASRATSQQNGDKHSTSLSQQALLPAPPFLTGG